MNVKVDVKKEEVWERVLAIEVSEDDVAKEYDRVAQKVARGDVRYRQRLAQYRSLRPLARPRRP